MISLTLMIMISYSHLFAIAILPSTLHMSSITMCREHSTIVNYQGSHLVTVRAAAVAHLVLVVAEAVVEITIHLVVWILMNVIPTL